MGTTKGLKPLLSTEELAEYLDVPVATVYAWRYHRKGPPGFRIGRYVRYRLSDVEDWLSSRPREPSPPSMGPAGSDSRPGMGDAG